MKLEGYKDAYEAYTKTLSDINRQIAFAGIALIMSIPNIFRDRYGLSCSGLLKNQ